MRFFFPVFKILGFVQPCFYFLKQICKEALEDIIKIKSTESRGPLRYIWLTSCELFEWKQKYNLAYKRNHDD